MKLNDNLVNFPIPEGMNATKLSQEEFVDVLEDGIPLKWKLEFEKKGHDLSSATIKEFLDVCMHLEEAELHKPLSKRHLLPRRIMMRQKETEKQDIMR
eukprot:8281007-Ditylum_brightwellii.AAC.1